MIRLNVLFGRTTGGIDPAGSDARLNTAQNIRGQTVAYDEGGGRIEIGDSGEAVLEENGIGFGCAHLFGNEAVLKIGKNAGTLQAALLHVEVAIADDVKLIGAGQCGQGLLSAGEKIRAGGEIGFLSGGHRKGVYLQAVFLK